MTYDAVIERTKEEQADQKICKHGLPKQSCFYCRDQEEKKKEEYLKELKEE
jgi:hypothetical protein